MHAATFVTQNVDIVLRHCETKRPIAHHSVTVAASPFAAPSGEKIETVVDGRATTRSIVSS
jgi:hypothetical protein